jgi:acyl-CoA synthetase (AMP-forming)/AMP-acid ligase II
VRLPCPVRVCAVCVCARAVQYPIAFHAVASLGGVLTTSNPLYNDHELAHQLTLTGARFLLTVGPLKVRAVS